MTSPRLLLGALLILAAAVSCSRPEPPPPATETPFPVVQFPYEPASKVVLEGRDEAGRLVLPEIDVENDVFHDRTVVCTIAHGTTASVTGFQYQPDEKRWYVSVQHEDCGGHVPESLVRRPEAYVQ